MAMCHTYPVAASQKQHPHTVGYCSAMLSDSQNSSGWKLMLDVDSIKVAHAQSYCEQNQQS